MASVVHYYCKIVLYDNFWHGDTQMNFSSSACLIFFVLLKTRNQLKIYFCLVSRR